ncbi:MAG: hypothetical protein L3J00_06445 [Thiomicrorhabdus sp.]|nr:hypothetical protein [Thiomicrorhabdus sp.]
MHFVNIDPLLSKRTGRQFPPTHKNNFGFVEDISPDRWGRNLLKKMIAHTPSNIEAGDPSVGFGLYAMALHMLGLATELDLIGAPERDEMGNLINEADLPKRIRRS